MTFFIFILMQILLIITKPWLIILMLQSKTMGNYLKTSSKNIQKFCSSVNFKYVVSLIQGCGFLLLNFLYIYTTVFILLLTGMINCVSFQKLLYHCLCNYYFWMMCYFFSHFLFPTLYVTLFLNLELKMQYFEFAMDVEKSFFISPFLFQKINLSLD